MKKRDRVSTGGAGDGLDNGLFGGIDLSGIEVVEGKKGVEVREEGAVVGKKGRVDVRREKSGRGGKTVTVLAGIVGIEERRDVLKKLQKRCGCGGTIKGEVIEVQGDKREEISKLLKEEGYRVVMSGG